MKMLYIKPEIEFELIEATEVLAGSPPVKSEGYDGTNRPDDLDPTAKPGTGDNFGAKEGSTDFSDDFDFQLDM